MKHGRLLDPYKEVCVLAPRVCCHTAGKQRVEIAETEKLETLKERICGRNRKAGGKPGQGSLVRGVRGYSRNARDARAFAGCAGSRLWS